MNAQALHPAETLTGTVLEIQRMSTEDGPGIRTTVFMKGCPLSCAWCHNPESISPSPQVHWLGIRCISCGICETSCKNNAISKTENGIIIDRSLCAGCGACADECPSTALELLGRRWTVRTLADELAKDRAYFEKSSGGVTLSGGESTMQPAFSSALLKQLRDMNIRTAIDTCGLFNDRVFDEIFPFTDMILYDMKQIDPVLHKKFTGSSNEKILRNLIRSAEYVKDHLYPKTIWIRTPLIPGATASIENVSGIGKFIAALPAGTVSRWDLCAFNNLCADKYSRLGINWPFADTPLIEKSFMEELAEAAENSGVDKSIVSWSGTVRQDICV